MKYAMQSSVHADQIEADVWRSSCGESAILSFKSGILTGTLSMHIPPEVADATANAFNLAMAEHLEQAEKRRVWRGAISASSIDMIEPTHDPDFTFPRPEPIDLGEDG